MATDYGTDVSCIPDLDPSFTEISGRLLVAENVVRRWSMPRGFCADDPDAGYDARRLLNRKWDRKSAFDAQQALGREAEKEEAVYTCIARLQYDVKTGALRISADLDTIEGTFSLVANVDSVTLTLLGISS